ncbi:hypothetical protein EDD86DRAFT_189428 [Gorgonomyces haynaldii]|nr:hypothetical protein EDD86DRAFT_189428 [Gorgonomyces haynaldii]
MPVKIPSQEYLVPWDINNPRYPGIVKIIVSQDDFSSKATVAKGFKKGQVIAKITGHTFDATKRWTSVQVGKDMHIELNSELVYMNHSCDPSVKLDTTQFEIVALRDLEPGDEISFFYPSTEWDMAKPFNCWCQAKNCVRVIAGAKNLKKEQLKNFFFNQHIHELLQENQ